MWPDQVIRLTQDKFINVDVKPVGLKAVQTVFPNGMSKVFTEET